MHVEWRIKNKKALVLHEWKKKKRQRKNPVPTRKQILFFLNRTRLFTCLQPTSCLHMRSPIISFLHHRLLVLKGQEAQKRKKTLRFNCEPLLLRPLLLLQWFAIIDHIWCWFAIPNPVCTSRTFVCLCYFFFLHWLLRFCRVDSSNGDKPSIKKNKRLKSRMKAKRTKEDRQKKMFQGG